MKKYKVSTTVTEYYTSYIEANDEDTAIKLAEEDLFESKEDEARWGRIIDSKAEEVVQL